jgi:hypothetical protein
VKPTPKAPAYVWLIPSLGAIARDHGYALTLHGSLNRDMDLVAVPWIETAADPDVLVEAIRAELTGYIVPDGTKGGRFDATTGAAVEAIVRNPDRKPHGRLAWNIHLDGGLVIDLSVMPRAA